MLYTIFRDELHQMIRNQAYLRVKVGVYTYRYPPNIVYIVYSHTFLLYVSNTFHRIYIVFFYN